MSIQGLDGLTADEINQELRNGARFVVFEYCISVIVMTFKRGSGVHFIRAGHGTLGKGLGYTLVSLLLGWWGIPWGPIWTISTVYTNLSGGRDVTREVLSAINRSAA
jgi:hypothetical protein